MQHDEIDEDNEDQVTRASVGRALTWVSEDVADAVADRIHAQLDSYAPVPRADIVASVRRNVSRGVDVLINGSVPTSLPEDEEPGATTRQRLESGARWEDILRAYRYSLTAVHAAFLAEASRTRLNDAATLEGSSLLWDLGEWFMEGSANAVRIWSDEVARATAAAEAEFIRGLLTDRWREPHLVQQVARLNLDPTGHYRVFITSEAADVDALRSHVVSAILQHRRIGLLRAPTTVEATQYPVALGEPTTLDNLSESAHVAETIWPLISDAPSGIFDLARIGWRTAVPQLPQLGQRFVQRYLEPLAPETESGAVLVASLKSFLDHDGNIRLAAQQLNVHENSLRYRLERFTEKTDIDVHVLNHQIQIRWAIAAFEQQATPPRFGEFYKR